MIETTKNMVWAVNSLFSALATVLYHFFAYTLFFDFRLLNHKWQNTFGKGHIYELIYDAIRKIAM